MKNSFFSLLTTTLMAAMLTPGAFGWYDNETGVLYGDFKISMPRFRYQLWEDVPFLTKRYAMLMGYTNETWNVMNGNHIENITFDYMERMSNSSFVPSYPWLKPFEGIVDPTVTNGSQILEFMGFTQDQWDCWMNHFWYYEWFELERWELNYTFINLGWSPQAWSSQNSSDWPESYFKDWANLTAFEQQQLANICYLQETWDGLALDEWVENSTYIANIEWWYLTDAPSTAPSDLPTTSLRPSRSPSNAPSPVPTITASPTMTASPTAVPVPSFGGGGFAVCFPGTARVTLEGGKTTELENVKLGDKILTDNNGKYETVYSFGHYDTDVVSDIFMTLQTANSKSVTLSPKHMVMTANKGTIAASKVEKGDSLITSTKTEEEEESIVTQIIKNVKKRGMYAPFTDSGYLIVDGIVASNYIAIIDDNDDNDGASSPSHFKILGGSVSISHQWIAHAFNAPHRFYCNFISACTTESYTDEGLSTWIAWPMSVIRGMYNDDNNNDTTDIITKFVTLLFVMVASIFDAVEVVTTTMKTNTMMIAATLGMFIMYSNYYSSNNKKISA